MEEDRPREEPLGDFIDLDLPAEEFERLARVDAFLRAAAARDLGDAITPSDLPSVVPGRVRLASVRRRAKW